jgi:hypothetical protein
LAFVRASLILANSNLPLKTALCFFQKGEYLSMQAEKSYLTVISKRLKSPEKYKAPAKLIYLGIWLAVVIIIITMLQLFQREMIPPILLIFISLLLGAFLGIFITIKSSRKCWPILAKHLDADSINKRLGELET